MKKLLLIIAASLLFNSFGSAQNNVGINTTTPDASAALDINSANQGILVPRLTQSQRDVITSPANGLLIYQKDNTPGFYYFDGSSWKPLSGSGTGGGGTSTVYGDGSAGNLSITSNTDWTASPPADFNFQFSGISIAAGATLTVPSGTKLRCNGNVSISGMIIVKGSEKVTGIATSGWISGVARTFAGNGENISYGVQTTSVLSLVNIPAYGGAAGATGGVGSLCSGGEGGGSFAIYANGNITISAAGGITANGGIAITNAGTATSTNGSGGGGGGIVVLLSKTGVNNTGTISAAGGAGSDSNLGTGPRPGGGGGGGGIILLVGPSVAAGNSQVNGGANGNNLANSGNGSSNGGAGGGSGGNGGAGGVISVSSTKNVVSAPTAGIGGILKTIASANPENLY
ncbi:hypothetical protein [Dyadobacter sp. NIV53]|uniref:hypothetical protein n=1 Tax=Dyadobacter sp. NIV53 TaxID=2861765 RepID=UPI001C879FD0|nr:hypothetical protein [Dyadobacter sp. NIV53]